MFRKVLVVTLENQGGEDFLSLFDELLPQLPELQYVATVGEEDLWYDDQIFQFEDLLSSGEGRDYPLVEVVSALWALGLDAIGGG